MWKNSLPIHTRRPLRWVGVALPVVFGLSLMCLVLGLVYGSSSGMHVRRLSEIYFLENVLRQLELKPYDGDKVVSFELDQKSSIKDLERLVVRLDRPNLKKIFLFIDGRPDLITALKARLPQPLRAKIFLAVGTKSIYPVEGFQFKIVDDCRIYSPVLCSLSSDQNSLVTEVLSTFGWHSYDRAPRYHLTDFWSLSEPTLIIRLPAYQWSDDGMFETNNRTEVAFIGFLNGGSVNKSQQFFAQLAFLADMKSSVAMPPAWLNLVFLLALCVVVVVLLYRLGSFFALLIFMLYALVYPVINILLVEAFDVYVPIFDFLFIGYLTFFCLSYVQQSMHALNLWRFEARHRALLKRNQLRGNFIALISHDLNTPVAKMSGLVDLLFVLANETQQNGLVELRKKALRLQFSVKAVLWAVRLEGEGLNEISVSLRTLQKEFEGSIEPFVRKMGSDVCLRVCEDDYLDVPIVVDSKIMTFFWGCLALLLRQEHSVSVMIYPVDGLEHRRTMQMVVTVDGGYQELVKLKSLMVEHSSLPQKPDHSSNFFEMTLKYFVKLCLEHYDGSATLTKIDGSAKLSLSLFLREC